jgi:UDP-glucuronate 4-epimerase
MTFIEVLEQELGKSAQKNFLPLQPGEVLATYADVSDLADAVGFRPSMPLSEGLHHFVQWYREYYRPES